MPALKKAEAKLAVEKALTARKLSRPMTKSEMTLFCLEIYPKLDFRSKLDRLHQIRLWAERWQSLWLPRS